MRVSICGGGVSGASIAYFLSCRGVGATVIEGTGLACAASGKSGGFWRVTGVTARRWQGAALRCTPNWFNGSPVSGAIADSTLMAALPVLVAVAAGLTSSGCRIM
jgi:hypothetical protein